MGFGIKECHLVATGKCKLACLSAEEIAELSIPTKSGVACDDADYCPYIAQVLLSDEPRYMGFKRFTKGVDG